MPRKTSTSSTVELLRRAEKFVPSADLMRWKQIVRVMAQIESDDPADESERARREEAKRDLRRILREIEAVRPNDRIVTELLRRL